MNNDKQLHYRPKKVDNKAVLEVGKCQACAYCLAIRLSYSTSHKAIYRIRDRFETLGSVCDAPISGLSKTSMNEENKILVAMTFVNSPNKSTRRASSFNFKFQVLLSYLFECSEDAVDHS